MKWADMAGDEDDADEDDNDMAGGLSSDPHRRRRGREEALYGIWAADEPDSDSSKSSRSKH